MSTPIFASKPAFFSIFQALPGNPAENASTFQKSHKSFAPKFEHFFWKYGIFYMFWYFHIILTNFNYISYFDISPLFYICILKFWEILQIFAKICDNFTKFLQGIIRQFNEILCNSAAFCDISARILRKNAKSYEIRWHSATSCEQLTNFC